MSTKTQTRAFSIPSVIALIAAALSFTSGAIFGMIMAVVAIVAGLAGIAMAAAPSKRGGIASTLAVAAGVVGVLAAVIKAILWFF